MRISVTNNTEMACSQELKLQNICQVEKKKPNPPLPPPDSPFAYHITVCVHGTNVHDSVYLAKTLGLILTLCDLGIKSQGWAC